MIAKRVGRLANRIVLFSHFIGAAAEHDLSLANPAFGSYARYFPSTARDFLCRFPPRRRAVAQPHARELAYRACVLAADAVHRGIAPFPIALIRLRREDHLDLNSDAFLNVVRENRIVLVQDWFFRNADNCIRHRDVIRSYFTPWEGQLTAARAVVERARRRERFVVGLHVRRTDYARFKDGRFLYSFEQYQAAAEAVQATFGDRNVAFLVSSDEPIPPEAFAGLDITLGSGDELVDLYSLAACDALVGPPSTYTAWASYWGDVPRYVLEEADAIPQPSSFVVDRGLGGRRIAAP